MVALPKGRVFKCSINEKILDYNGKTFLGDGRVCQQKRHDKEKKNVKKCITKIEKYHNKKS